ncbi:integral membrane protein [Grosmannia clavigera kw1407]|uniref:Integral membrane protein n=1 Tax=Grosmannia clavigera (strain kw1407 / UAMH 11150) TaxID=655863 RepID=F0XGR5_GROCL|nr:uncharacterized protein CMQ_3077 [Grosmannia clavigera kw1407]EFX03148.1 integral membrane protein [Grosmannia clavigera kw1407]
MLLADLLSMALRLAELAFAAIVAGLSGSYLHSMRGTSSWHLRRFIYAEVVAGLSILLSIVWLFPFAGSFIHWPVDIVLAATWFTVFGLLVNWLHGSCGSVFDWHGIALRGSAACPKWKADIAFSFLSAICWLVSGLLGIYRVHRRRSAPAEAQQRRGRWYRARV